VTVVFALSSCSSVDPELEKRNKFDACVIKEKSRFYKKNIGSNFIGETKEQVATRVAESACVYLLGD
jgi:hypothetical protein